MLKFEWNNKKTNYKIVFEKNESGYFLLFKITYKFKKDKEYLLKGKTLGELKSELLKKIPEFAGDFLIELITFI